MNIIIRDSNVKRTLLKQALLDTDNIIENILKDYSQELVGHYEGKDLALMVKKLRTTIYKNIGIV